MPEGRYEAWRLGSTVADAEDEELDREENAVGDYPTSLQEAMTESGPEDW